MNMEIRKTKMHPSSTSWIVAILFMSQMVAHCEGTASLKVKFITYNNPNSRDWSGQVCDLIVNTACDNVFRFCLDVPGGNNNFGAADCSYGVHGTGEFRNWDMIQFATDMFGVANPIEKQIDSWQNVRLKVEVRDDDSSHSGHDLVDRYYYTWQAVPGVNNTAGSPRTVVLRGQRTATQKTSLTVQFSVKCDAHYYGPNCAVYCKYRDDSTGHYRCTQSGQRECLTGWEDVGGACTVRADDCEDHDCENGASCVDGNQAYTCRCPPGYTGTRCETDIDECVSSPCRNNGTCVDEPGGFRCDCPESHPASLSPLCAIHTCLHDDPCQNGGTCYGAGLCDCPPNYTGSKCEMHFCQAQCISCMNGGVCTGSACDCPQGTLGGRCEVRLCDIIDCVNGGTCINGTCRCAPGYEGKYCHVNVDDCGSSPCANGGVCVDRVDLYLCQCGEGYTGANCETLIPTTTTTTTTTTTKATTTKERSPNGIGGRSDYLTDKPGVKPVTKEILTTQFMVLIIILVVLLLIVIILVAVICKERRSRKKKENRTPRPNRDPNSNFENPVYTMERQPSRPNPYGEGHYLQPQATGGAPGDGAGGGGFVSKGESPYAHPPMGPARPVGGYVNGEPLYDHPRPYPPPYSPEDEGAGYSRSIDHQGPVRMGDIKARVEEEEAYEELKMPRH